MRHFIPVLAVTLLTTGSLSAQAIVGSWLATKAGKAKSAAILTFLSNGTYVMAEDGDRKLDPSGMDGMERGTYTWNPKTRAFSSKTLVDTTGEWGLSDGSIKSISVAGDTLEFAGIKLTRVTSTTNKLIGSWYLKKSGGYALATFLADGSYFMVQDGPRNGGGKTGLERGNYTWNTSTKDFTNKVLLDTNGTWGFSDITRREILISKNILTLHVTGEGSHTLKKVVAP